MTWKNPDKETRYMEINRNREVTGTIIEIRDTIER